MKIKLQGEDKKRWGKFEGNYTLQPTLCIMQPHWTNKYKTCSIWFENGRWIVGYTSDLGKDIGAVTGPLGEVDWPQKISSGWKFGDAKGTWLVGDVIFEDKSTGKLTI